MNHQVVVIRNQLGHDIVRKHRVAPHDTERHLAFRLGDPLQFSDNLGYFLLEIIIHVIIIVGFRGTVHQVHGGQGGLLGRQALSCSTGCKSDDLLDRSNGLGTSLAFFWHLAGDVPWLDHGRAEGLHG
jgi:hypothetical protein